MTHGTIQGDLTERVHIGVGTEVVLRNDIAGKCAGIVWVVEKFLTKNAQLIMKNGTQRLRVKPHLLLRASTAALMAPLIQQMEPVLPVGTVVWYAEKLYVVLATNPSGRYRIVKLGGDNGKYFTNVSRSLLKVADMNELLVVTV